MIKWYIFITFYTSFFHPYIILFFNSQFFLRFSFFFHKLATIFVGTHTHFSHVIYTYRTLKHMNKKTL